MRPEPDPRMTVSSPIVRAAAEALAGTKADEAHGARAATLRAKACHRFNDAPGCTRRTSPALRHHRGTATLDLMAAARPRPDGPPPRRLRRPPRAIGGRGRPPCGRSAWVRIAAAAEAEQRVVGRGVAEARAAGRECGRMVAVDAERRGQARAAPPRDPRPSAPCGGDVVEVLGQRIVDPRQAARLPRAVVLHRDAEKEQRPAPRGDLRADAQSPKAASLT